MSTDVADSPQAKRVVWGLSFFVSLAVAVVVYALPNNESGSGGPSTLATLNASLNASAGVFLVLGYMFVRRGSVRAHRFCMTVALGISSLFLITYLLHHSQVGSVAFTGTGLIRAVYFALLVPHIILAAVIVPMALFTAYRGLTNRIGPHRSIAKWTLPLWLYVSFSGVAIYWLLYHH